MGLPLFCYSAATRWVMVEPPGGPRGVGAPAMHAFGHPSSFLEGLRWVSTCNMSHFRPCEAGGQTMGRDQVRT